MHNALNVHNAAAQEVKDISQNTKGYFLFQTACELREKATQNEENSKHLKFSMDILFLSLPLCICMTTEKWHLPCSSSKMLSGLISLRKRKEETAISLWKWCETRLQILYEYPSSRGTYFNYALEGSLLGFFSSNVSARFDFRYDKRTTNQAIKTEMKVQSYNWSVA